MRPRLRGTCCEDRTDQLIIGQHVSDSTYRSLLHEIGPREAKTSKNSAKLKDCSVSYLHRARQTAALPSRSRQGASNLGFACFLPHFVFFLKRLRKQESRPNLTCPRRSSPTAPFTHFVLTPQHSSRTMSLFRVPSPTLKDRKKRNEREPRRVFVVTAECSKRSPEVGPRKSPVLLCRSSSVRVSRR